MRASMPVKMFKPCVYRTEQCKESLMAAISELVSYRKPDGFIMSTGNLYFTYHDAATASV
jgi:hypothetical protein